MRILFMGTPDFAVPCLEKIHEAGHELCGVFTQPDKPKGRGMQLQPTPVKRAAQAYGVPVYQPATLKNPEVWELIRGLGPDCIAVTAYGRILPEEVLNFPRLGCINVHASLLPAYRGAAPMQWAVINGETVTGVTTMYMAKGIDTGDMILKRELAIGENETFGELHDRMAPAGAELLMETLRLLEEGRAPRTPQSEQGTCYAPMIDKAVARLDFKKPALQVHNLIRGLSPVPGASTLLNGRPVKIYRAVREDGVTGARPGAVVNTEGGITVCCGDGTLLRILELQEQGGKRLHADDYLRGHRDAATGVFGD